MIKPEDLKLTYEEFVSIVGKHEEVAVNEWKRENPEDRDCNVWISFYLSKDLIKEEYLTRLQDTYISYGWGAVEISFVNDDRTGCTRLHIRLYFQPLVKSM